MLLCGFFFSRGSLNLVEVLSAKQHAYTTQQTAFPCAYEPKQQVEETKQKNQILPRRQIRASTSPLFRSIV